MTVGLIWIAMAFSYLFGTFLFTKIAGFLFMITVAILFAPTFYEHLYELCVEEVAVWCLGFYHFGSFLSVFIMPFMLDNKDNYKWMCFGIGSWIIILTNLMRKTMVDTKNVEKTEIHLIFRGLNKNKAARAKKKTIVSKVKWAQNKINIDDQVKVDIVAKKRKTVFDIYQRKSVCPNGLLGIEYIPEEDESEIDSAERIRRDRPSYYKYEAKDLSVSVNSSDAGPSQFQNVKPIGCPEDDDENLQNENNAKNLFSVTSGR